MIMCQHAAPVGPKDGVAKPTCCCLHHYHICSAVLQGTSDLQSLVAQCKVLCSTFNVGQRGMQAQWQAVTAESCWRVCLLLCA